MKKELSNKNVVITGASFGIGEKIAMKVAQEGGRPILLARSLDKLKAISEFIYEKTSVNSLYYQLDVSDVEQVKTTFTEILKEVRHIDILVNNAGFGIFDEFKDASFDEVTRMFEVNVLGLMACTKEVLPLMIDQNSGHIINIASQAGKIATPKSSVYSATKHAVLGFTNSLRMELADTKVHVSAVNPGPIETNFFNTADKTGNYVKNVQKFMLSSDYVADKIIQLMTNPKRELNLPYWMHVGSVLYAISPSLFEKISMKFFNMK